MSKTNSYPIRVLSLFSGIGGFEVGLQRVFPNMHCVGFSEVDPEAIEAYSRHFPDHKCLGAVQEVKGDLGVDLIVAGSPCKDLSQLRLNNKREGLDGKQSGLFYEFLRIYRENSPCYFILENVASMPESEKDRISRELGGVQPIMLDSKYVSAQRRKRLFWTNFPVTPFTDEMLKRAPKLSDILVSKADAKSDEVDLNDNRNVATYYSRLEEGKRVSGFYQVSKSSQPKSKTLTTCYRTWIEDHRLGGKMRKLHPREGERLQTLPDGWVNGFSHKVQMRMLGNAVTADVIAHVAQHLSEHMNKNK